MVDVDQKIWYLQQIDLFQGIEKEELMRMADRMVEKQSRRKEIIYTPFEDSNSIYVLKKGEVTLYSSHEGRKIVVDVLKPGSIFGNISFQPQPNTHFAEVTEDAFLCIFSIEDFKNIIRAKPELAIKLLEIVSVRLSDCENRIKGGLYGAKDKVLHYLRILEEKGERSMLSRLFSRKKRVTHEELSHHSGLSRETVTRAINDLKREGKVTLSSSGRICLEDGKCL